MGYREDFFRANPSVNGYYQCVKCKGWFPKSEIDVDHKISKRYGGSDQVYNLQAMCKHCNRSKRERSSTADIVTSVAGAVMSDNTKDLVTNFAKQKVKDMFGIKYKR